MSRKKILMACTHHWTSPMQVGSHHLAREFVKAGYDVAYLSAPVTPLHLLKGVDQDLAARFSVFKQGGRYDQGRCVWSYVPGAWFAPDARPLLNSRKVYDSWFKFTFPDVVRKVIDAGFGSPDVFYIDNLSYWFWLECVSYKQSVFRIMDNHAGFPGAGSHVKEIEGRLGRSVDLVVYSAATSLDYVETLQPRKKVYLPNGVDFHHFALNSKAAPQAYRSIPRPRAVYLGAMDARFDFELVQKAAQENPGVSFVLIGPRNTACKELEKEGNIHLLGPIPYNTLPPYLHHAEIGIIPFNVEKHPDLIHSVHPLKLYQYMACGLAVVSTEWDEIKNMNTPALICSTQSEFSRSVGHMAFCEHDRNVYRDFASQNDWSKRLQTILNHLNG